jgi:hypothetical protein
VQIDGVDFDNLTADNGGKSIRVTDRVLGEEVDTQLETRLEGLQVETDELLVKIAEFRRTCPEKVRQKFYLQLEDLERAMPGITETLSPLEVNFEMNESALDVLLEQLDKLKNLNQVRQKSI